MLPLLLHIHRIKANSELHTPVPHLETLNTVIKADEGVGWSHCDAG